MELEMAADWLLLRGLQSSHKPHNLEELPTWPRPFLAQPITSPAPRPPLVGQREREREAELSLVLTCSFLRVTVTGRPQGPTLTGALLWLWMHLETRSPWHRTRG